MFRLVMIALGFIWSMNLHAFSCYITVIKDTCWSNYNVSVHVLNSQSQVLASVMIPKGTSWSREQFTCHPGEILDFEATFSPVFWEQEIKHKYFGKRHWHLPENPEKGLSAWNVTLCFAKEFSEVPFPPDAVGHCRCETKNISPVKLESSAGTK